MRESGLMHHIAPYDLLSIGETAARAGVSVPALRYYEERRLIRAIREPGGRRMFPRHVLRRLAVIAAGQRVGMSLEQIGVALSGLPEDRAPNQREWRAMSERWAQLLASRIRELEVLQSDLDGCIGCGCLSLGRCTLFNPGDEAQHEGPGSRWLRRAVGSRRAASAQAHEE
ncbi:MerR family transcriptional regulator, redox-sensitive transcriptional activator SoxR [Agreia bicolorata]|uniref:MerR family transcriptional regulator, redox-sensitive transcriptional activator SoxR n=2 Tax=Agreia bicolorata TaxID=110935 RepID=A0A1T4WWM5_9MICO|nr:MerR family transcriptional regulator, redox-sensitive transcriptional activator SoxR [Agreia bicolorata]